MAEKINKPIEDTSDREIIISRVFDAPRELVWEAWTDPKHVVHWWGPNGFTTTVQEMDVRPGGVWKHVMHGPDGTDYPNKSVFVEVVKPERIVYSHGGGKKGGPGAQFQATWTFVEQGDKTQVTGRMVFKSAADRDQVVKEYGAIEGGKQTLQRLAEYLPKMEAFVISRTFNAPRELVWKTWTEPEHIKHWWGPKGSKVSYSKMDLRPGGINHYCLVTTDGHEMWGRQIYREIIKPERLVFVNSFSDEKGGLTKHPLSPTWPLELLTTIIFTGQQGQTIVTVEWLPINATAEERKTFDAGRESMKQGWGGSLDQLEQYLAKI